MLKNMVELELIKETSKKKIKNKQKKKMEMGAEVVFLLFALMSLFWVISIAIFIFYQGLMPFFGDKAYKLKDFLFGLKWDPANNQYGILYMIIGSVYGTIGAIIIGLPIGILTSVFIAELAPKPIVRIIEPAIDLLAAIPSVVYGVFGVGVILPMIKKISGRPQGESLLAVIIVLSIMILPTIINVTQNSIKAVAKSYREASLALGASQITTIFKVVLPAAKSGILSATVLGIGRALGETMAVMMIAGNPIGGIPKSIFAKVRPLTSNISMEMGYASGLHQKMLFSTGVVLFIFIIVVNIVVQKMMKKVGD